jgi:ribonuclease HII
MRKKFDPGLLPASPNMLFEQALWQQGFLRVAGIDEAGRGPLAGPVCAACVLFPPREELETLLAGVQDSKQMAAEDRVYWAEEIKACAVGYGIGFASAEEIDERGIVPAIHLAVERALAQLPCPVDHLLVDYLTVPVSIPQTPLVKGDARSLSIAAASVIAKTARDALMIGLDAEYPGYGFASHKGYGTPAHLEAISVLGPCSLHRRSFRPISQDLLVQEEVE